MRKRNYKILTRAEIEVMNYLWSMDEGGTVHDVQQCYPEPLPAYTTTATFLKILTQKGFVTTEKIVGGGKSYLFRPVVSRDEYRRLITEDMTNNFFDGSVKSFVSFFVKEEKISEDDLKELLDMVNQKN